MKKPNGKRTEHEINKLKKLISEVKFFTERSDLTDEDLSDICQYMRHEEVEKMEEVIRYGARDGTKFYIIVLGVVVVKVPNHEEIEEWELKYHEF